MSSTCQKAIAWSLIVVLTIITCVNEGLHFVPGFGHAAVEGDKLLLLGITLPNDGTPASSGACVGKENSLDNPILDEDECPVCSATGKHSSSGDSVSFDLAASLVNEALIHTPSPAIAATGRDFLPRAPPRC